MENKINGMNRETYLEAMTDKAVVLFENAGYKISDIRSIIKVSCGFPPNTRIGTKFTTLGVCINPKASESGNHEIYINPVTSESVKVIDILIHELTHAMTNTQFPNAKQSHGKEFKMVSKAIQMDGNKKFKYACANPDLIKKIKSWIKELGEYPHDKITLKGNRKKQGVRNLKVECQSCEWSFRTSNKNILLMVSTKCLCCGDDEGLIVTF
tara:strand:+ start:109 stop:741 length:633 start_codon:yes stop_codon:yes gene_type:complete